jgi:hypothetical protein
MGIRDFLFGRSKLKEASGEKLFALSTACVTLEVEQGLKPAGVAAVVFKPQSSGDFARVDEELQQLLESVAAQSGSTLERSTDSFGFVWLIVRDPDFEDLVTTAHLITSELQARGFGPQVLAAVFRFEGKGDAVYWIYGYKRGAFWPFVPTGREQERDNAKELELKAKLEKELPIEPDLTRWLALFDAPI